MIEETPEVAVLRGEIALLRQKNALLVKTVQSAVDAIGAWADVFEEKDLKGVAATLRRRRADFTAVLATVPEGRAE